MMSTVQLARVKANNLSAFGYDSTRLKPRIKLVGAQNGRGPIIRMFEPVSEIPDVSTTQEKARVFCSAFYHATRQALKFGSTKRSLQFAVEAGVLTVVIEDNGTGFSMTDPANLVEDCFEGCTRQMLQGAPGHGAYIIYTRDELEDLGFLVKHNLPRREYSHGLIALRRSTFNKGCGSKFATRYDPRTRTLSVSTAIRRVHCSDPTIGHSLVEKNHEFNFRDDLITMTFESEKAVGSTITISVRL
jgi:hypothetical protein